MPLEVQKEVAEGKKNLPSAFLTAVHELMHFIDYENGNLSSKIISKAIKAIGLRKNSIELDGYLLDIMTSSKYADKDDEEIFAWSIEKVVANKGNKLSKQIYNILMETLNERVK